MAQTLDELRAEVAAEDAAEAEQNVVTETEITTPPQAVETETDQAAAKTDPEVTPEVVEPESENSEDVEDWMKSGDEPQKEFTSRDIKAAKTNLKAKLDKRHSSETDELRAEIEQLKKTQNATPQQPLKRPKRDDFFESDEPDQAYDDAVLDYTLAVGKAERSAEHAAQSTESQASNKQKKIGDAVDGHYERAAELAHKSGISAEAYRNADLAVKEMVESLYPNSGDSVVDELISIIGKGSERVIYNLGVNKTRLNELRARLSEDKSGMTSIAYLAELNVKLNRSVKPNTNAPPPADTLKGDGTRSDDLSGLKKDYETAVKGNDMQAAFDARRSARKGGVDVTQW